MRRLLNRQEGPPVDADGHPFRYVHSETGHKSHGNDYISWLQAIREHIKGNNLPMPENLAAIAEDQLCGTLPPHLCLHEQGDAPPADTRIAFTDVVDWLKAVGTKILGGFSFVPKEEAERRAGICVSCFYNVTIVGGCGGGCKKLVEFMTPGMANLKTSQDTRLRSCGVCKCFNSVAVHFPLEVLEENDNASRQASYPPYCWKKHGGSNFQP
jgi:hypothetical protein